MNWKVRAAPAAVLGLVAMLGLATSAPGRILPCTVLTPCPTPPPPPPHKPPKPKPGPRAQGGATYDGHQGKTYSELVVTRSAGRVARYEFAFHHGTCSDGGAYASDISAKIPRGANIDEQGRASYSAKYANSFTYTRAGKRVNGVERIDFVVHFSKDKVQGTVQDHFSSSTLHCSSGSISFVSYRDGTRGAPLRTGQVETGRYQGAQPNGKTPFSLKVYLPWQMVNPFRITWVAKCRNGGSLNGNYPFYSLTISHNRFSASGSDQFTLKGGYRGHEQYRASGHFFRVHGDPTYRVRVNWVYTAHIYKGSRQVTTCPMSVTDNGVGKAS